MTAIAVIVPVLNRPKNAHPLMASFKASNPDARLTFVVTESDEAEIKAIRDAHGVTGLSNVNYVFLAEEAGPGDYARKINVAYRNCDAPYVLCAADDLRFHEGWDTALLRKAEETGAGVIGSNDLGNAQVLAGKHSTHPLVHRSYIAECGGAYGEPGVVYHEGYDHQWVDCELIELAKWRGCYAHAHDAVIEHLHPLWRKAEMDDTYRRAMAKGREDARLFQRRQKLWIQVAA